MTKETKVKKAEKVPSIPADAVVVCPHCGAKVFYEQGACKWCYGKL